MTYSPMFYQQSLYRRFRIQVSLYLTIYPITMVLCIGAPLDVLYTIFQLARFTPYYVHG